MPIISQAFLFVNTFFKNIFTFFKNFSLRGVLLQNMCLLNWQSAQNKTVKFYVWASGKKAFFVD
jgi:Ni,Fe-hydrogenase I cytochrome b subunit